jgi:hypothetical protein
MMEAIITSETSVHIRDTGSNIPEDTILFHFWPPRVLLFNSRCITITEKKLVTGRVNEYIYFGMLCHGEWRLLGCYTMWLL